MCLRNVPHGSVEPCDLEERQSQLDHVNAQRGKEACLELILERDGKSMKRSNSLPGTGEVLIEFACAFERISEVDF